MSKRNCKLLSMLPFKSQGGCGSKNRLIICFLWYLNPNLQLDNFPSTPHLNFQTFSSKYFTERSERRSYASTQSLLCDSTPHKLLDRRRWNSTQRQITLLTMSPLNKILEKSLGSGSGDKNVLLTFLLETILLINGSFWIFAHEDIIEHQIISNGKKHISDKEMAFLGQNIPLDCKNRSFDVRG